VFLFAKKSKGKWNLKSLRRKLLPANSKTAPLSRVRKLTTTTTLNKDKKLSQGQSLTHAIKQY